MIQKTFQWEKNQHSPKLAKQSIEAGQRLAAAYQHAVMGLAQSLESPESIYAALARMQHDISSMHAESIYETQLIAWLDAFGTGYHRLPQYFRQHLAEIHFSGFDKPPETPILNLFFPDEPGPRFTLIENAAKALQSRQILSRDQFDLLSHQARASAFTIGDGLTEESIEDVRKILNEAVSEGPSLAEFRNRITTALPDVMTSAKVELVYRQAINASYRDGRESLIRNPVIAEVFPYQQYLPIHDGRVRHEHLELGKLGIDGTDVYRREDPIWDMFTPPWDYNCRCGVNMLTIDQAARLGVQEAKDWLATGQKPPLKSRLPFISFRPRIGFGQRSGLLVA